MPTPRLRDLPNLGPTSEEMLTRAGIATPAQLQALGAIAAFVRVRKSQGKASMNLLWALEGALCGQAWQTVARDHRTSLLLALEDYEQRHQEVP